MFTIKYSEYLIINKVVVINFKYKVVVLVSKIIIYIVNVNNVLFIFIGVKG